MKKIVLIAAVAATMFSCNKEEGKAVAGFKSAYVDTAVLVEKSDEMKDLRDKAKVKEGELTRELQQEAKQLQLDAASFEQEARAKGQQWAQIRGQQLQERERNLTIKQQQFQQEFAGEFGVQQDTMVSQIKKLIKDYGKKKGYDYVFNTSDASTVLYSKDGYNITDDILKQMNEKYKSTKKDAPATPAAAEPAKK
jgi:outer membrane protein